MIKKDEYLEFLYYALNTIWFCYEKTLLFSISSAKITLEKENYSQDIKWLEYQNSDGKFKQTGASYINKTRHAMTMQEILFESNAYDTLQMIYLKMYQVLYDTTQGVRSFSCYKNNNSDIENMLNELNKEALFNNSENDKDIKLESFLTTIRHNFIAHQNFDKKNNHKDKYYRLVNSNNFSIIGIKIINDIMDFVLNEIDKNWKEDEIFAKIKYYDTNFLLSIIGEKVSFNSNTLKILGNLDIDIQFYEMFIKRFVSKKYIEIVHAVCDIPSGIDDNNFMVIGLKSHKEYILETAEKVETYGLASDEQVDQFYAMLNSNEPFRIIGQSLSSNIKKQ